MAAQGGNAEAWWPEDVASRLLELTVDLACVVGFDGRFQLLADGWTELLGHECDGLIGRPLLDFVHPDDAARSQAAFAAGRDGGAVTQFQNRLIARDGTTRWLVWSALAQADDQRFHAVARDITPQREAEEQVHESERRYRDMIESSHDIVQSIRPDGHFEFVNRSWHEHLGYSEGCRPSCFTGADTGVVATSGFGVLPYLTEAAYFDAKGNLAFDTFWH